jgi:hypothetical protein
MVHDRVALWPSERIDKDDLERLGSGGGTTDGFAESLYRAFVTHAIISQLPAIASGFRVEIRNQATNPGEYTVVNGSAFDRSGRLVVNPADLSASRTRQVTSPLTVYYIEVEFITTPASRDSRAFWNPTVDNGTFPSGDPKPDGREYQTIVATRWFPDWQIVERTDGFSTEAATTNSIRIPLCTIKTDNSGQPEIDTSVFGTFSARTVLRADMAEMATVARCLNTRELPDFFTATIDGETVAVVANDRANNNLTISAGVASAKLAGARVINTTGGGAQYLTERRREDLPVPFVASGSGFPGDETQDARPRLFQGNEPRGYALSQDPYTASGQSDVQLSSLKDLIDAQAARERQMKFGGMAPATSPDPHPAGVGQSLPPASYNPDPRYYEPAGSICGSYAHTVSIGDGVLSFGDLNTNAVPGGFVATMQMAIDFLAATGGRIYVKRGAAPYDVGNTTIEITDVSKGVVIVGDGDATEIRVTGDAPALTIESSLVTLENLRITRSGGSADAAIFLLGTTPKLVTHGCKEIAGVKSTEAAIIVATHTQFTAPSGGSGIAVEGVLVTSEFSRCEFRSAVNADGSRCLKLAAGSIINRFYDCVFQIDLANPDELVEVAGSVQHLTFRDCFFTCVASPGVPVAVVLGASTGAIVFDNCTTTGTPSLVSGTNVAQATFEKCGVNHGVDGAGVSLLGTVAGRYTFRSCTFTQTATGGSSDGAGIKLGPVAGATIDTCRWLNCDFALKIDTTIVINLALRNCDIDATTLGRGHYGIFIAAGIMTAVTIDDVRITGLDNAVGSGVLAGIRLRATTAGRAISIANCKLRALGGAGVARCYGIRVEGEIDGASIGNCELVELEADTDADAVVEGISIDRYNDSGGGASRTRVQMNRVEALSSTGHAYGVRMRTFYGNAVDNNTVHTIGSVESEGLVFGIHVGDGDLTGSGDQQALSVSGNKITALVSDGTADPCGIQVNVGCEGGTIGNNVVLASQEDTDGIRVIAAAGATVMSQVHVTENVVRGAGAASIRIGLSLVTSEASDRVFRICGNTVYNFVNKGIFTAGEMENASISNNVLWTQVDLANGIELAAAHRCTINGNAIELDTTQGEGGTGILLANGATCTVVGNTIRINRPKTADDRWGVQHAAGSGVFVTANTINTRGGSQWVDMTLNGTNNNLYTENNIF